MNYKDDKHVPMQHQGDYNPPIHSNGCPVKPNNIPIMCEGPGPEIIQFPAGLKDTDVPFPIITKFGGVEAFNAGPHIFIKDKNGLFVEVEPKIRED